jgi:hypothetical protein
MHNEGPHNLYSSPSIGAGNVARMGHVKYTQYLVGKPGGHFADLSVDGRPILRYILTEICDVDWIQPVHHGDQWQALANTAMTFRVP